MITFDSVPHDTPVIAAVSAEVFRYVQTVAPLALEVLAFSVYVVAMLYASHVHPHTVNITLTVVVLLVLMANLLRRIAPFMFIEVGHYRYERVSTTVTRLLPNTFQSWMLVQTLAVVAIGHPLCLYIFTYYTVKGTPYAFAMLNLPDTLGGTVLLMCVGILICLGLAGLLFGLLLLPPKRYNPFHVSSPEDRLHVWLHLSSWLPLSLMLIVLLCASRLLSCDETPASFTETPSARTCGSGTHWRGSIVAWLLIAMSFLSLDAGITSLRLLGGRAVVYYSLEPRIDSLFGEFLMWALKVTAMATALLTSGVVYAITTVLFLILGAFSWRRHVATAETLEEIMRSAMVVVVVTCTMLCFVSIGTIPAVVQGILILLAWLLSIAGAITHYYRRFGYELFSSGRNVTADIIVL
ncbi:hypothetical protein JKF63_00955 [Porcisia hertigi]|uniref:Uncharacterized protein n=1 Tax=Porcisia hertigi TaxID=2761500 RepID=A0A836I005_9TRYP|nr:hypothetical protein JKF63_00955 [Porcisia hertigi]